MKILLMGFSKIKYMPYLNFYLNSFNTDKNEVHVLYWNRDLKEEKTENLSDVVLHEFRYKMKDSISKILKIKGFLEYKKFASDVLKKNTFDAVFVLHSLPGVLLHKLLFKHYFRQYIFDYRDVTYENIPAYKKIIHRLIDNSYATFISSKGFESVISHNTDTPVYISHNLSLDSLSLKREKELGQRSDPVRVSYWGFIRNETLNKQIIKQFASDKRFVLHYYGKEEKVAVNLKAFASELGADNVFFHGEYSPEERYTFINNTDIIHNIFSDDNMMLAMSNKYYDGVIFKVPQLCMKDSVMGLRAEENAVGFQCDPYSTDFTDRIYDYYKKLDRDSFSKYCDNELACILDEFSAGSDVIKKFTEE